MDALDRHCVQRMRDAKRISLVINAGMEDELIVNIQPDRVDMRKLSHDLAISLQTAFNHPKI